MDDTPTDDPISELKNADPADSPDVADRIAEELAAELDGAAPGADQKEADVDSTGSSTTGEGEPVVEEDH